MMDIYMMASVKKYFYVNTSNYCVHLRSFNTRCMKLQIQYAEKVHDIDFFDTIHKNTIKNRQCSEIDISHNIFQKIICSFSTLKLTTVNPVKTESSYPNCSVK